MAGLRAGDGDRATDETLRTVGGRPFCEHGEHWVYRLPGGRIYKVKMYSKFIVYRIP